MRLSKTRFADQLSPAGTGPPASAEAVVAARIAAAVQRDLEQVRVSPVTVCRVREEVRVSFPVGRVSVLWPRRDACFRPGWTR